MSQIDEVAELLEPTDTENVAEVIEEEVEEEVEEVLEDDTTDTEEDTTDTEEDDTEEDDTDTEEDDTEGKEDYSVKELSESIGWKPEELYGNLKLKLSDGEEPISLGELKDNYILRNKEIAEAREEIKLLKESPTITQVSKEVNNVRVKMEAMAQQFQEVDWEALENEDAGRAVLEKQKYTQAYSGLQNKEAQLIQQENIYAANALKQARVQLLTDIPAWVDNDLATKEKAEISKILLDSGFELEELKSFNDPRAVKLMNELNGFRKGMVAGKKKLSKPRMAIKKNARVDKEVIQSKKRKANIAKARTGGKAEQIGAVEDLLAGML